LWAGGGGDPAEGPGPAAEGAPTAPRLDDAATRAAEQDSTAAAADSTVEVADETAGNGDEGATAPVEEVVPPEPAGAWAEVTLEGLTLREKVGQLLMPWVLGDYAPDGSASHERIRRYVEEFGVGGVIMSVGQPTEVAAKLNDLQEHARIPLLVAADLETGAGFRLAGAVHTPGN